MNDADRPTLCNDLDDYFDGTLAPDRRKQFVGHLTNCDMCRESVELQEHIERLLRQATSDDPSMALRASIERQIHAQKLRKLRIASAAIGVAAAIVVFVLALFSQEKRPTRQTSAQSPSHMAAQPQNVDTPTPAVESPSALSAEVTVETGEEYLAVRQPTKHPNVSVFWLYPTVRMAADATPVSNEPLDLQSQENAL